MRAKFNDGTQDFENQCVCYLRTCPECGTRFKADDTKCSACGTIRPRCKNKAMEGEHVCRQHSSGRPYSLYSKLAGTLTDTALEELMELDDRSLDQEYALAKVALSSILDQQQGKPITSEKLMSMVDRFFKIAERKKNIEQGQVLNISWNDELVNSLRKRVKQLISLFKDILEEYIEDPDIRKLALKELKERSALVGNMITSPMHEDDYKQD